MSVLADLVREFCREKKYEVYENYAKTAAAPIGGETYTTIGIVLKQDDCGMPEVLEQLTGYIMTKALLEQVLDELDGAAEDELDLGRYVVCFPAIQDYQPPQPQRMI